jgi:predicted enzyme related to lactoylglutathione lyase
MGMIYFEIQAEQAARAARFYTDVFGWKFTKADGTPVEYWRIDTGDGGRGGLLKRPAAPPPPYSGTNAYVCSFEALATRKVYPVKCEACAGKGRITDTTD